MMNYRMKLNHEEQGKLTLRHKGLHHFGKAIKF